MDTTPRDAETEVRDAVRAILLDWVDPSSEATERFMAVVRERFTGYGTGPGDYYANRDELRAMVLREHAGMSYPFTLDIPWMTVHLLDENAAVAVGEICVSIELGDETVVETPRFTFALDRQDDQWHLAHFHFSVPDAMQPEGGTMDDLLTERTRQLEEEVARRTAELDASLVELKAAQAQLVQQEKMASLGALTAGIAHEIKNPLNFVTNFADLSVELTAEIGDDLRSAPERSVADALPELEPLLADLAANAERIRDHGRLADRIVQGMMLHARGQHVEHVPSDVNGLLRLGTAAARPSTSTWTRPWARSRSPPRASSS